MRSARRFAPRPWTAAVSPARVIATGSSGVPAAQVGLQEPPYGLAHERREATCFLGRIEPYLRQITRIAHLDAVGGQPGRISQGLDLAGIRFRNEVQKFIQIMGFRELDLAPHQKGLQKLLRGLLGVEADGVEVRRAHREKVLPYGEILFRLS
jgi:hypothetical protein